MFLKSGFGLESQYPMTRGLDQMLRQVNFALFLVFLSAALSYGQEAPATPRSDLTNEKILVVATETKTDSVVVVPPATSVRVTVLGADRKPGADAVDLPNWLAKEAAINGLESPGLLPWHIVVSYDQFDEDGDNVHSGVYEEYWAGDKEYKRTYQSDNLNQTDYATADGLFRQGDQKWPDPAQVQVRSEVITPFYYATTLEGFRGRNVERAFSGYKFQCVFVEKGQGVSDPAQYCFESGDSALRYSRGAGWFQTVYNRIEKFQGRNIARQVDVTDGGKPYLKLRVETLELLSPVDDARFSPPHDAIGPLGGRISGVQLIPISLPALVQWPASLRQQHFEVHVDIAVGKDGHVISAHATSGPPEGYKACEDLVRKWLFRPYLILDKPVEVEAKTACVSN
jgi:hypothetical protein